MIIPVRCFTCGKVVGHMWNDFLQMISESNPNKKDMKLITGKCEIERALNSQNIKKFENSILNSNKLMQSQSILLKKNLNQEQINTICEEIITIKGLKKNEKNEINLQYGLTSLQNLYNSIEILENIRQTPVSISQHSSKLIKLFKDLTGEANLPQNLITNRWIEIGFQGENPTTDFRAGGLLALENLLYFSTNHTYQAQFCLNNSKQRETQYFFAVCGIYITKFLTECMKQNYLDWNFYKCDDQQRSLQHFNELYTKFFNHFDNLWCQEKRTIMEFHGFFETTSEDLLLQDQKLLIKILGQQN